MAGDYVRQEVNSHLSLCYTGVESVSFEAFGSARIVASQICGIYANNLFRSLLNMFPTQKASSC